MGTQVRSRVCVLSHTSIMSGLSYAPASQHGVVSHWPTPVVSFAMHAAFTTLCIWPQACTYFAAWKPCLQHHDFDKCVALMHARAVTARPFLADFSCAPPCGGCVSVNPGGMMSPPFTVRYNKVLSTNYPCLMKPFVHRLHPDTPSSPELRTALLWGMTPVAMRMTLQSCMRPAGLHTELLP